MMRKKSFVVSLIGRPNVGKSSLFNRLLRRANKSITYDMPGVTRDRHYALVNLDYLPRAEEVEMILVDTGGFIPDAKEATMQVGEFFSEMVEHAKIAIQESDLVLLITDVRQGPNPHEEAIIKVIRHYNKTFWVVPNKYDTESLEGLVSDFYSFGIDQEQLFPVSAAHALGVERLGEALHKLALKGGQANLQRGVVPREKVVARLAIIGTPNAGKSTILNRLLGDERALVSPTAGTTMDPIEGYFDLYFGKEALQLDEDIKGGINDRQLFSHYKEFRDVVQEYDDSSATIEDLSLDVNDEELDDENDGVISVEDQERLLFGQDENIETPEEEIKIDVAATAENEPKIEGSLWRTVHVIDTAGIRKARSIESFIEQQSVYRALRCISESDIVLLMVDATKGLGHQERRLIDISLEKGKYIMIGLNKFDLLRQKLDTPQKRRAWLEDLRSDLPWIKFVDMIPISAKYGDGMGRLKETLKQTILLRYQRVGTSALNRKLEEMLTSHPLVLPGTRKMLKLKYASMVKTGPATFLLFTNGSKGIPIIYRRYLVNGLRKSFGLNNGPVHLIFRSSVDLDKAVEQ